MTSNPDYTLGAPDGLQGVITDGIYITDGEAAPRTVCQSPTIPASMARTTPWRVEDFQLHKELYKGKTSQLFMATDKKSGIQVALKLYRKRKLSTLNRYQVEREIRIHIKLDHENIIKLFAAFEDSKNVYMVQEFAGGGDLFEDLKRSGGTIKEKPAVREIITPFLNALAYLHSRGIVHRDIKPENILLTSSRQIKIADFGLSINVQQERPVTRAGTLDYMAPEVLVCPDKRRPEENKDKVLLAYTAQVDAWAVGILAYELLVGYPPFEQESRAATYEHIMYKEPKFPSCISEDAKKFIAMALCKNASQRPTVTDLAKLPWIMHYIGRTAIEAASMQPSRLSRSGIAGLDNDFAASMSGLGKQLSVTIPESNAGSPSGPSPKHVNSNGSNGSTHASKCTSPLLYQKSNLKVNTSISPTEAADSAYQTAGRDFDSLSDATPAESPSGSVAATVTIGAKRDLIYNNSMQNHKVAPTQPPPLMLDADGSYSEAEVTAPRYFMQAAAEHVPPKAQQMGRTASTTNRGRPATPSMVSQASSKTSPGGVEPSSPIASQPGSPQAGGQGLSVERSASSYIKPQSGVLSDDNAITRINSSSHGSMYRNSVMSSGLSRNGLQMERPNLERLFAAIEPEQQEQKNASKYTKPGSIFSRMWGGGSSPTKELEQQQQQQQQQPQRVQASTSSFSGSGSGSGSGNGGLSSPNRKMSMLRGLQDEALQINRSGESFSKREDLLSSVLLRQDSMVMQRQDSMSTPLGMNSVEFKQPVKNLAQRQNAVLGGPDARGGLVNRNLAALQGGDDDLSPVGRVNSESVLVRPGIGSSGRSFTTMKAPGMKKLAQGAIATKVQEYVHKKAQYSEDSYY